MLFNSFEFLLFLPIVFLLYWFVFGSYAPKWLLALYSKVYPHGSFSPVGETGEGLLKMQNLFIVVVSYIFYGWWDWRFLLLIALTTFCSWLSGLLIVSAQKQGNATTNNHDTPPPYMLRRKQRTKNQKSRIRIFYK